MALSAIYRLTHASAHGIRLLLFQLFQHNHLLSNSVQEAAVQSSGAPEGAPFDFVGNDVKTASSGQLTGPSCVLRVS